MILSYLGVFSSQFERFQTQNKTKPKYFGLKKCQTVRFIYIKQTKSNYNIVGLGSSSPYLGFFFGPIYHFFELFTIVY